MCDWPNYDVLNSDWRPEAYKFCRPLEFEADIVDYIRGWGPFILVANVKIRNHNGAVRPRTDMYTHIFRGSVFTQWHLAKKALFLSLFILARLLVRLSVRCPFEWQRLFSYSYVINDALLVMDLLGFSWIVATGY